MSLVKISEQLKKKLKPLQFSEPVTHVYNPLEYAWDAHKNYLERFGTGQKEAFFLGMNPGPWGMAQTGVPFGEVAHVKDWMGITGKIKRPKGEHPKRPVLGWECERSEVSGRRLWGWVSGICSKPEEFFDRFFVINYCPLLFLEESGRNRTPDKLPVAERNPLSEICDEALLKMIDVLQPKQVVGVGGFARDCLKRVLKDQDIPVGMVLHPSPASPRANRGWEGYAKEDLTKIGLKFWP